MCFDETAADQQAASKPRRLSARLQELRERNKNNNNDPSHQEVASLKASSTKQKQSQSTKAAPSKRNAKRRRTTDAAKSSSSKSKKVKTKKLQQPIELEEYIREDEDQYIIHPDFRLRRLGPKSYDTIRGMSKYDRENKDDVLQASPYVSDLIQHNYSLEVSRFEEIAFSPLI